MANEKTPVVWDDTTKKHRPLGTGEKMGGLDASSLLSSDSGNLLEAGSDGLAYLSGSGVVDPRADNLLEESDRGKLQVTVDRITEWLDGHPQDAAALADAISVVSGDEGNVVVQGTDKGALLTKEQIAAALAGLTDAQKEALAQALAGQLASQLADGHTIVASAGKLTSDPTNATAAQKAAINSALADADSGLVVDPSTGKLTVDFSNMPTDRFEELLAGLKMQVPLSANLTLHVDNQSAAAGDDVVDGRGTEAKPFRTVSACVSWAAGYYSLGSFSITVLVHPGTYDETVTLPQYNASSGIFLIAASDPANPPVLRRTGVAASNFSCTGGHWRLRRLKVVNNPVDLGAGRNYYPYCIIAQGGARVQIYGCEFEMSYYGESTTRVRMCVLSAEANAALELMPMAGYGSKFAYHLGNGHNLYVLNATASGSMRWRGSFDTSLVFDVQCQGDATAFAAATNDSIMQPAGGGDDFIKFVAASGQSCTGVRYQATGGSGIVASSGGFPGDAAGTVEASTYSWYKE